jgi:hypothetical protein
MRQGNMKGSGWKLFAIYGVAVLAIAYLIFVLAVKGDAFSYLHFGVLLLIVVLIIIPVADKLKIFNFIDFSSKLDTFRSETKKELSDIRSQISANIRSNISPIQQQFTFQNIDEKYSQNLVQALKEVSGNLADSSVPRIPEGTSLETQFINRANSILSKAYVVLMFAHVISFSIYEKRLMQSDDLGKGELGRNGLTKVHLDYLMKNGLSIFVPATEIEKTKEELSKIPELIALYEAVEKHDKMIGESEQYNPLIDDINDGLGSIIAGEIIQQNGIIVSHVRMKDWIDQKKKDLEGELAKLKAGDDSK